VGGARLRWIRQRRGLSMRELGEKATVHSVTIGKLEKGRRPAQLETVRKLAGALEVEVEEPLVRRQEQGLSSRTPACLAAPLPFDRRLLLLALQSGHEHLLGPLGSSLVVLKDPVEELHELLVAFPLSILDVGL
jgi:transcriptional regulator with XRE-family HTH domain